MSKHRRQRLDTLPRPRADYDAIVDKRKRTPPRSVIYTEEEHLLPLQRRRLNATALDQARNISALAWMIRKHRDYTSRFRYLPHEQSRLDPAKKDAGFARAQKQFIAEKMKPQNFDAAGKMDFHQALGITECSAALQGDFFWHLL